MTVTEKSSKKIIEHKIFATRKAHTLSSVIWNVLFIKKLNNFVLTVKKRFYKTYKYFLVT